MDVSFHAGEPQLIPSKCEAGGSDCWSNHLILLLPIEKKQKAEKHRAQAGCCLFLCPLFFFFLSQQEYVSLPLLSSATCGNLSVTAPVLVLLLLAWAMHWNSPNIYLGGSEPVGLFSLILAINLGVGRDAMVQLTPTLVGAGGKRYMTAERFSQRPWKLSFPYFVPSEQGDVFWFDLRPWGWCILTHLFVFGFWFFLFLFLTSVIWACFNACHVLVDLRDW